MASKTSNPATAGNGAGLVVNVHRSPAKDISRDSTARLSNPGDHLHALATIRKNGREEIRVDLVKRKGGSVSVDVRLFVENSRACRVPTSAGVQIRRDLLRQVIDALIRAELVLGQCGGRA